MPTRNFRRGICSGNESEVNADSGEILEGEYLGGVS